MTAFKHLLVTTDFSEASLAGVEGARDLAAQLGAKLSLLHISEAILPPLRFSTEAQRAEIHQQTLEANRAQLDTLAKELVRDVPTEPILREGRPHAEIIDCAEKVGADLIVMASQGRGAAGQFLFGSTTQRVIQTAPCPVMVVRGPQKS